MYTATVSDHDHDCMIIMQLHAALTMPGADVGSIALTAILLPNERLSLRL